MRHLVIMAAALLSAHALAASDAIKLQCGSVSGIKTEAEMKAVPGQGIYTVDLTFIASKPGNKDIDRLLRECAAVAVKRDPSKDILVSGWFRKRPGDNWRDDDLLHPYGATKYLSYEATSKSIGVRELKIQKR